MNRFLRFRYIGAALLIMCAYLSVAQNVKVDPTFNVGDTGSQMGVGFSSDVLDAVYLPDGKIIAVGTFTSYNGVACHKIARLNPDGTLDESFNTSSGAIGNSIRQVHLLPDGKILITGNFSQYKGVSMSGIARLHSDGTLDESFTSGMPANASVISSKVAPNGKIIVGGLFATYSGFSRRGIAVLNSDGTLDESFNPGTGATPTSVSAVEVQPDGKILIGGNFSQYNGVEVNRLARLNSDGTLDNSFAIGTGLNALPNVIKSLADGKILIGGTYSQYNDVSTGTFIRLELNGSRDASFSAVFQGGEVTSVHVQNDGNYLVSGKFTTVTGIGRNGIARIQPDGTLLAAMAPTSIPITALKIIPNGDDSKYLVCGTSFRLYNGRYVGGLVQVDNEGAIDESLLAMLSLSGFNNQVNTVAVQSDGKVLVGGYFTGYSGQFSSMLIRLLTDGTPDASFQTGTGFNGNAITNMLIDNNEKIIVTGDFTTYNGIGRARIARLNSDGSLDATFNPEGGVPSSSTIQGAALQSDGKIIIVGSFTSYRGVARNRIARINTDGSLDVSFNPQGPDGGIPTEVVVQPDGKILVGGSFLTFNGQDRKKMARLNSDGSLDLTFNQVFETNDNGIVLSISFQSTGKIIVGYSTGIFRLNTDGTQDQSYTSSFFSLRALITMPNDKILAIGANGLFRYNEDGTPDERFDTGGNMPNLNCLALSNIGDIYIGGSFTMLPGNIGRNRFTRLNVVKPVTIGGVYAPNKIYDGTTTFTIEGTPVLYGLDLGDAGIVTVDASNASATSEDKYASNVDSKQITFTGFQLTGPQAHKYELIQPTGNAMILPKSLIITGLTGAKSKVYDGDVSATITGTPTFDGILPGDDINVTGVEAYFDSRHAGEEKTVTVTGLQASGLDKDNYTIPAGLTFISFISPKPVEVEIAVEDKEYDGTLDATFNVVIFGKETHEFNTVQLDIEKLEVKFTSKNAGNDEQVIATNFELIGEGKENYYIDNNMVITYANITKKKILAKADDATRKYGEQNLEFTIAYEGLVDGDNATDIDEAPVANTDAPLNANAGTTYTITLAGGSDNNYEFEYEPGTLTITKATQTITFNPVANVYNTAEPFEVTATASSGLPVEISVTSGPAAYEDGFVKLTGDIGEVTLNFEQAGNMNYEATSAITLFQVSQDPIMSTESSIEHVLGIYPVPAKSTMKVALTNAGYKLHQVNLYNLTGVLLRSIPSEGKEFIEINVEELPAGVLVIEVLTSNHERVVKRVTITK